MKRLVLSIIMFVHCCAFAQQEKLLTHFMYDKISINPASTGVEDAINATMLYRNQWDKISGAPNSALFNIETNLNKISLAKRNLIGGIGFSFYHDQIGFTKQNNVIFNYSYPFQIGELGFIHVGLGLGLVNLSINPDWIPPTTMNDPLLTKPASGTNLDANLGVYWKSFKGFYAGFSSTHVNQPIIKSINFTNKRHYFLTTGYRFSNLIAPAQDIDLQFLMRSDLIKISADFNARYFFKSLFYLGLTYRTTESISFMAGFYPVKHLTFSYSYDITTNGLNTVSRGSHELVMRYSYTIPDPPLEKTKHPRWL